MFLHGSMQLNICMEQVQLTVADLASIRQIIEAACTRGAFRANEMTVVGNVFDKLTTFLAAVAPGSDQTQAQGDQDA